MKKSICILFLFIAFGMQAQYVRPGDTTHSSFGHSHAQPENSFAQHLSLGGGFVLQFGDVTFIELEPLLSYHFNENLMVGIGPIYQYESENSQQFGYSYTSSIYGGRVNALYFLPDEFSKVFIMGEYEVLNVPEASYYTYQISRGFLSIPMFGLGYKDPISDKAFIGVYVLWNFNNSIYNPYTNPIINFGIDIGLWH